MGAGCSACPPPPQPPVGAELQDSLESRLAAGCVPLTGRGPRLLAPQGQSPAGSRRQRGRVPVPPAPKGAECSWLAWQEEAQEAKGPDSQEAGAFRERWTTPN